MSAPTHFGTARAARAAAGEDEPATKAKPESVNERYVIEQPIQEVRAYSRTPEFEAVRPRLEAAIRDLGRLNRGEIKNLHNRIQTYRRIAETLVDHVISLSKVNDALAAENDELKGTSSEHARKRWTDEQDQTLVDMAAEGGSVLSMATTFGRTPGAIAARVSHLVGVKRMTYELAASIFGYLNGAEVAGAFVGTVRPSGVSA